MLHTLPPRHTRSATSLPLSIFYREIKKDVSFEGNHIIKYIAPSRKQLVVPIRRTKCRVIPLERPDLLPFHCCAVPMVRQLPGFTRQHLRLGVPTGHPFVSTLCWPGLQGGAVSWGPEVWLLTSCHNQGLLCLSAFLMQSANLPGNCIPLQQVTSGSV